MYDQNMSQNIDEVTAKIATELRVTRERMKKDIRPNNAELAAKVGISAMAIGRYMSGDRAIPVPTYMAICEALRVDPGALMAEAMKK